MDEPKKFTEGGVVKGTAQVHLDDAECVINVWGVCIRYGAAHEAHHIAGTADTERRGS